NQKHRNKLPQQNRGSRRQMSEANGVRNQLVENRGLQLHFEEVGVVRIKRGIQVPLDGGQINAVVLDSRVVALYQHGQGGKYTQQQKVSYTGIGVQVPVPLELTKNCNECQPLASNR